ncbi:hypothetical protein TNCV_3318291 [Trichonephila clavipes]|nr:hypothetical protein TNCV_3318291 [Trichonephila clavipes]
MAARFGKDPTNVSRIWNRWVHDCNAEQRDGSQRLQSLAAEKTESLFIQGVAEFNRQIQMGAGERQITIE